MVLLFTNRTALYYSNQSESALAEEGNEDAPISTQTSQRSKVMRIAQVESMNSSRFFENIHIVRNEDE